MSRMTDLTILDYPRTTMSSLAANVGFGISKRKIRSFVWNLALHKYRCFVNCSWVKPPVVGHRIPLSRIGYVRVTFWLRFARILEYVLD